MVVHVGIDPWNGKLSYYKEDEKKTVNLYIKRVRYNEDDKVISLFEEIKTSVKDEFGYLCICLNKYYGNSIRKLFVTEGFKCGFKNVEIIDWESAFYLNAMSQTNFTPLNGNIIWIYWEMAFIHVWEINEQKAKFCGESQIYGIKNSSLEAEIKNTFTKYKTPDVILYLENELHKRIFEEHLAIIKKHDCQLFTYIDGSYYLNKGSLLKARITAGDRELIRLHVWNSLDQTITLKYDSEEIISFDSNQQLPIIYSGKIRKKPNVDVIEIIFDLNPSESIKLRDNTDINFTFQIDTNGIYLLNFNNSPNLLNKPDTKLEKKGENTSNLQATIEESFSSLLRHSPALNLNKCFIIPKKEILLKADFQAVGIDLGTSRCCVAVNRNGVIATIPLDNSGERLLPSYVSYNEENIVCGKVVVNRLRNYSKSTIFDSKRIIGRSFNDIEIDDYWCFSVNFENDKVLLEVNGFNGKKKKITAEEVAADLLKHMKQKTEEFQGEKMSKVVITVPAAFTESQKSATIAAAKLAGWNEIKLLPEPIAAAFAYFIDRPISNNSTVLLFDLGGGTLDVCIFKVKNNEIQIISNIGDSKLGGRNFDTILINYFKNMLNTKYGIYGLKDKKYRLLLECQKIKEDLSAIENCSLDIDEFDQSKQGIIPISREEFQSISQTLLNKIRNTIHAALFSSNLKENQINKVLHVGGGSRMPMIKRLLKEIFSNSEHCCEEHPDEVVAIGAAYYAYTVFRK